MTAAIDSCGSAYDTELGVYTLLGGELVLLTSNDDTPFCPVGALQSRIVFTFQAGVQYYIVLV